MIQTDLELDMIAVLRSELLGLLQGFLLRWKRFGCNRLAVELTGYDVSIAHCFPSGAGSSRNILPLW